MKKVRSTKQIEQEIEARKAARRAYNQVQEKYPKHGGNGQSRYLKPGYNIK